MHIFNNSKYTNWYFNIINNTKNKQYSKEYCENHHIIPKCIGGLDNFDNLVKLSAREHYICHLLLTKMTHGENNRKMKFALWRMTHCNDRQNRYKLNNRQYEKIKKAMSNALKEQNTGKKLSLEHIEKLKKKILWNKGKKGVMSAESKAKISEFRRNCTMSEETKEKISTSIKNRNKTIKNKIGEIKHRKKRAPRPWSEDQKIMLSNVMKESWAKRKHKQ